MKKLLLFALLALPAFAQVNPQIQGAGAPSNPCANGGQEYVDTTNHVLYSCPASGGNWVNRGLGNLTGGGVTVTGAVTAGHIATFASASSIQDGGAGGGGITNGAGANVITKSDGTNLVASSITDNATTVATTEPISSTTGGTALTHTQGTITTSNPTFSHTGTWNAGGVAFTNWSSNVTCTASAASSYGFRQQVGALDTGGFGLFFNAANCASPMVWLPAPAAATPNLIGNGVAAPTTGVQLNSGGGTLYWLTSGAFKIKLAGTTDGTQIGMLIGSAGGVGISSNISPAAANQDVGIGRKAAGILTVDTGTVGNALGFVKSGMTAFVTGNFTTAANTNLQTITGLSWTFPAIAANWRFTCDLTYSQATAAAAVAFGIQAATNAPTNIYATGIEQITAGPPATIVTGTLATLSTTTATNIVSGTPGAQGTNYTVHLAGLLELPASANTVNIMVSTATSGDAVTVLRGSSCALAP